MPIRHHKAIHDDKKHMYRVRIKALIRRIATDRDGRREETLPTPGYVAGTGDLGMTTRRRENGDRKNAGTRYITTTRHTTPWCLVYVKIRKILTKILNLSALRPMPMETRSSKVFFFKYIALEKKPKFFSYRRCGEKGEKCLIFYFPPPTAAGSAICFFWLQIVNTVIETSSCDNRRSIST